MPRPREVVNLGLGLVFHGLLVKCAAMSLFERKRMDGLVAPKHISWFAAAFQDSDSSPGVEFAAALQSSDSSPGVKVPRQHECSLTTGCPSALRNAVALRTPAWIEPAPISTAVDLHTSRCRTRSAHGQPEREVQSRLTQCPTSVQVASESQTACWLPPTSCFLCAMARAAASAWRLLVASCRSGPGQAGRVART
jgi:hypothetical protein